MIVDLMRNDLGRVCSFGSVRVDEPRVIESHGRAGASVLQAVSSVSGRLRESLSLVDVVRAVFPGGSITGAPKIRAMQIIEELDEAARGPYCGAVGYVSDSGDACFNVAIRTLAISGEAGPGRTISRGVADYWVGAGIVADSDPAAEWEETLVKASPIRAAFGG
jgi:anthranilate/para-aminobenzoate synthase component I